MTELTHQLKLSLQHVAMQKAIRAAVPLLRREMNSLGQTIARCKKDGRTSFVTEAMQQQHDELLATVNQCEAALNPESKPDVIPQLRCSICTKNTPGTIYGVCLACYEALNGMQSIEPCDQPCCAGTVVQMPRRGR